MAMRLKQAILTGDAAAIGEAGACMVQRRWRGFHCRCKLKLHIKHEHIVNNSIRRQSSGAALAARLADSARTSTSSTTNTNSTANITNIQGNSTSTASSLQQEKKEEVGQAVLPDDRLLAASSLLAPSSLLASSSQPVSHLSPQPLPRKQLSSFDRQLAEMGFPPNEEAEDESYSRGSDHRGPEAASEAAPDAASEAASDAASDAVFEAAPKAVFEAPPVPPNTSGTIVTPPTEWRRLRMPPNLKGLISTGLGVSDDTSTTAAAAPPGTRVDNVAAPAPSSPITRITDAAADADVLRAASAGHHRFLI
jgi:hypothetical protein